MQLITIRGSIQLTGTARRGLTEAARRNDNVLALLSEAGVIAIRDTAAADSETVPIERAYFDGQGFGPYDRADL